MVARLFTKDGEPVTSAEIEQRTPPLSIEMQQRRFVLAGALFPPVQQMRSHEVAYIEVEVAR